MQKKGFFEKIGCLPMFVIIIGLPFFLTGGWEVYKEASLKIQGKITIAKVLEKTYRSGDDSNTYHLKYEYQTNTNMTIVDECQVKHETWQDIEKGDNISVIYIPEKTYINRMAGESYFVFAMIFMLIGGVICSVAMFFAVKKIKKYNMIERLEREGISAEGKVIRVERVGEINDVPHSVLHYSFLNPNDGSDIEGKTYWIPTKKLMKYSKGDEIEIIYNPDKPTEHYWADEQEILDSED
jgi:hypothetical protein